MIVQFSHIKYTYVYIYTYIMQYIYSKMIFTCICPSFSRNDIYQPRLRIFHEVNVNVGRIICSIMAGNYQYVAGYFVGIME